MSTRKVALLLGAPAAAFLALVVLVSAVLVGPSRNGALSLPVAGCGITAEVSGTTTEIKPDQAANAKTIIQTGLSNGVPVQGLKVAIATAYQESKLRNLGGGDRDSLGLFQQRPSQGWGTPAQIKDPVYASTAFFKGAGTNKGLLAIPGWESMPIWQAAQAVQHSGFPRAYDQWAPLADSVVTSLLGGSTATIVPATCNQAPVAAGGGTTACPASGLGVERGLQPDTLNVLRCVVTNFPSTYGYGGVGGRPNKSDHPTGRALDVMVCPGGDYPDAQQTAYGNSIAAYFQAHAAEFGVTYMIFRGRIWSVERADEGWRHYEHPNGGQDPTSLHFDHVHISVSGAAGTLARGAAA